MPDAPDSTPDDARERRLETAQRLAEGAVGAARGARLGGTLDDDLILAGRPAHECTATTTIAVTSRFSVASGSSTFQPKLISWS